MSGENELGKLEGLLDGFEKSIIQLNKFILGNGQPGLLDRLTRVEKSIEQMTITSSTDNAEIRAMLKELSCNVDKLADLSKANTDSIKDHIDNKEVHSLRGIVLHKESIIYIIVGFLFLHTFLPDIVNISDLIMHLIGLK